MTSWPTLPADVLAALPEHAALEQEWQNALRITLPRVLPVMLHRQLPGKHKQEGGAWMQGAPKGAADLSGWVQGGLRLEIECKMPGKRRTPEQHRWARQAIADEVPYLLAEYEDTTDLVTNLVTVAWSLRRLLERRGVDLTIAGPRRGRGRG